MDTIRIGTRASRLALVQSEWVAARLREQTPGLRVELVEIRTAGDAIKDVPLVPALGSSFFTKEIEEALLERRVDLAVHSCKDLASRLPDGLAIGAVPVREDPRDVLVSSVGTLSELPPGATVGTSSPRRLGFLRAARSDIVLKNQRGNVPTRVAAVDSGMVHAVVLAAAGLARLGMSDRVTEHLEPRVMLPAAAQGALAVQMREDDMMCADLTRALDDADTRAAVEAERACLRRLEAGCQAPVGVYASFTDGALVLDAAVITPGGIVRTRESASLSTRASLTSAQDVGTRAAENLLEALGLDSLVGIRADGSVPRDVGART